MARRSSYTAAAQTCSAGLSILVICLGGALLGRGQSRGDAATPASTQRLEPTFPGAPTGASRCKFCHPAEVEGYARSAMAHSLRRAGQEPEGTVTAHGSTITMHSSPTGYSQSWENAGDKSDYRIDYVVGSGSHASGYLVDIGGHLFQSPVAFYTKRGTYDLAPGYENVPDPDFTRPVSEECVLCHSGNALHVPGTLNQYRAPIFSAEGITCERCHGPVERHLADPRAGTIINPRKLEPAARDSICEQCHLFGAARVANPGKKLSDFVPGQRLENTFTVYRNAAAPGTPADAFKVISHVEQLALSACARNSGGRLWCGTCHDPHDKPAQAVAYYRARCLTCHTANFPASHPQKSSDCLGCHMPRRDAQDGGHTAFTDHRIQRRPESQRELALETDIAAWREPPAELQRRNLGIAYIDVGAQRHSPAFVIQGYRDLTEVQRQFANDSELFKWIGEALLLGKKTEDAKFAFERALQLDPDSPLTEASAASPYMQEGDTQRAITHLERAVTLDPLYLPAASTLIDLYEKQGETTKAADLSAKIKMATSGPSAAAESARKTSLNDVLKKSEEVFKNIQVLKGVPSEQLIPAMEFVSSSLGVECSFCHVEDHFDKDDKKPKQTARAMMRMMFALNKNNFEGRREVTCYSCHRGAREPVGTPIIEKESQPSFRGGEPPTQELAANMPTASQLLERYVQALGGAAAIEKITSRAQKGVEKFGDTSVPVEIFTLAPDKQAVVRHLAGGDSVTVLNGPAGWFLNPGHAARQMNGSDFEAARMDADLQFALHVRQIYPEMRVEYPETIDGRRMYVMFCVREGQGSAKLYFEEQSGLLTRLLRYAESPLGLDATQIDYGDYRDVDGVQVPFRIVLSQPGSRSTMQMDEVRQNTAIDASRFSTPPL